jgi:hypothetical protein
MVTKVVNPAVGGGNAFAMRCPECGHDGTFHRVGQLQDLHVQGRWLGHRVCPNPDCKAHVFFVANDAFKLERTYPPLQIAFDSTNVPPRVRSALLEAVTCDAEQCFTAAALMVRRTLEALCEDRKATGDNLKQRLLNLRSSVVLPAELFDAMEELRILGNDAAHIEARVYDQIGHAEIEATIDLAKEVLKAVYQLDALVGKLRSLKPKVCPS